MFENAEVGDKVWDCLRDEWLVITNISKRRDIGESIRMEYLSNGLAETMTVKGHRYNADANPRFFWQKFEFLKQERPKRMVKKKFYFIRSLKKGTAGDFDTCSALYREKEYLFKDWGLLGNDDHSLVLTKRKIETVEIEVEE